MRIPISYYKEVEQDTLVSAVLDNAPLVNEGGTIYQIVGLDYEGTADHPDVTVAAS